MCTFFIFSKYQFILQVVARIKEKSGETELLVIDDTAYLYFASRKIPITVELLDTTKKFLATEESTNEDDAEVKLV